MNKLLSIILINVALAAHSSTYEFLDSEFNHLLSRELEELHDSSYQPSNLLNSRFRRDDQAARNPDRCRRRRFKPCCETDFMEKLQDKDKDLKKECFKQVLGRNSAPPPPPDPFQCEGVNKRRKNMMCVSQCVAQKKNIVDNEGNIKPKEFSAYIKQEVTEPWLVPVLDNIITRCTNEAKNFTSPVPVTGTESCKPTALKIGHCLFRESQINCPKDKIKDERACARFLERIKQGDFRPPPFVQNNQPPGQTPSGSSAEEEIGG